MISELEVKPLQTTFDDIKQPGIAHKWRLPKLHFKLLACGPSGSGKSTAVINLLNLAYTDVFDHIYLIGPTSKVDKVWDSLKLKAFSDRCKKEKISIIELEKIFRSGLRSVKTRGHTGPKTLLIFEDFINTVDSDTGKLLLQSHQVADLALVGRHAAISIVFLTQLYNKLPRRLRENCSHVIYLPSKQGENSRIAEDFCPPRRNKKWMEQLVMEATKPDSKNSHPFLFIDVYAEPEFKFRRNFNMLINWTSAEDTKTMDSKQNFIKDSDSTQIKRRRL
jgi:energy-coupling factor transporter ATP-binding protein EcfA2